MKTAVIIGSGIAGIVAGKILAQKGYKVKIIESSNKKGGLINSKRVRGYYFDHGPHMIQETNNRKINNYLFKKIFKDLNEFKFLPQNHFFNKTCTKIILLLISEL